MAPAAIVKTDGMPPEVVVHHLAQAREVLALGAEFGVEVQLLSAPDAAASSGVGYLQVLGEAAGQELLIDCGEDAGLVMSALRAGCKKLVYSGGGEERQRLSDMAERKRAALCTPTERQSGRLVLSPDGDAKLVRAWLLSQSQAS